MWANPTARSLASFLAFTLLLLAGCDGLFGRDADVRLRVHNVSDVPYENVQVAFPDQAHEYGAIAAGEASAYRTVERAYRYARIELAADGRTLILQPIDWVGERPLRPGSYTYEVDADLAAEQLTLHLVSD